MPFTQNEEDEIAEVEKFKEMEDLDGMLTMLMMLIMLMMLMLVFVIVMQWCSDDDDDDEDGLFVTAPMLSHPKEAAPAKRPITSFRFPTSEREHSTKLSPPPILTHFQSEQGKPSN